MDSLVIVNVTSLILLGACAVIAMYWLTPASFAFANGGYLSEPRKAARIIFLFNRGQLVDASPDALQLLTKHHSTGLNWFDVRACLNERVAELPTMLCENHIGLRRFPEQTDVANPQVILSESPTTARIEVINWDQSGMIGRQKIVSRAEWSSLMLAATLSPVPIWQNLRDGKTNWKNKAFEDLLETVPTSGQKALEKAADPIRDRSTRPKRVTLRDNSGSLRHFDINTNRNSEVITHFALDVTEIVEAQEARDRFVKSLGQTFAHLPIGLAVFDHNRELVLFNPALLDMFRFSAEFLISRPTLQSFFNALREDRMIPEHRDFLCWREQLTKLILDASQGSFSEDWQLPNGQHFHVTGRPHPDGAIAFLFEDITTDLTVTRQLNAQLDRAQTIFDQISDGFAATNAQGHVEITNAPFRALFSIDPESSFATFTLADLVKALEPFLSKGDSRALRQFLNSAKPSSIGPMRLYLDNHNGLELHISALPNNTHIFQVKPVMAGIETEPLKIKRA